MEAQRRRLTVLSAVRVSQVLRLDYPLEKKDVELLLRRAADAGLETTAAPSPRYGRTYVLLEGPSEKQVEAFLQHYPQGTLFAPAIVVLAIEPASTEVLPELLDAFAGEGKPAGVISAERVQDAVLLEVDLEVTAWSLIQALVAGELASRARGLQRVTLLNPLSTQAQTKIAASGLQAPEIDRSRILDIVMADAGF